MTLIPSYVIFSTTQTTPSASYLLEEDQELYSYALHRLDEFSATQNTTQKINVIFNAAKLAVKDDKEKHTIEWLHACILRAVTGSTPSMVTQGTYGAMGSVVDKKAPTASKPRNMKPSSHQAKPTTKYPGIVVSPYEDDMESTVEQALTIAQQQKRQNGRGISEGESDVSAAAGKNDASSKKKRKRKQKRGNNKKSNADNNNTLTVQSNEGGLTAPTSWYSGYDSATTDGSVTDGGGESDVSRNSTSKSRRKLGKKIKKGSLQPGAGYDAIVEKMTGSTQDVLFVKPFFFPDYNGKSFDVSGSFKTMMIALISILVVGIH